MFRKPVKVSCLVGTILQCNDVAAAFLRPVVRLYIVDRRRWCCEDRRKDRSERSEESGAEAHVEYERASGRERSE